MPLGCVYTDLDGTLLGPAALALPRRGGGLLAGAGAGAGGLPAGRGRGRDHVRPPRAAGARGGAADGPDLLHLRGRLRLRDRRRDDAADRRAGARRGGGTIYEQIEARGIPKRLFEHFAGRLEYHAPWHPAASSPTSSAARSTSTRPTRCSASTATTTCGCSTTARSAARCRPSTAPPTPTTWCRAWSARAPPSPPTPAPAATTRATASPSATRSRTSRSPPRSAASSSSPTAPSATPACAPGSPPGTTPRSPRAAMGDGFYEAVVSTLMERR